MKSKQVLAIKNATFRKLFILLNISLWFRICRKKEYGARAAEIDWKNSRRQGHSEELKSKEKRKTGLQTCKFSCDRQIFHCSVFHFDDVVAIDLKFNIRVYVKKTSQIQIYRKPVSCKRGRAPPSVCVTQKKGKNKWNSLLSLSNPTRFCEYPEPAKSVFKPVLCRKQAGEISFFSPTLRLCRPNVMRI